MPTWTPDKPVVQHLSEAGKDRLLLAAYAAGVQPQGVLESLLLDLDLDLVVEALRAQGHTAALAARVVRRRSHR